MAAWQHVLSLDARYNAYRSPNNVSHRTLYIRRRSQMLRERSELVNQADDFDVRDYLRLRSILLSQRYGAQSFSDVSSVRSRTISLRSVSKNTDSDIEGRTDVRAWKTRHYPQKAGVVPTLLADASRAMAGDTSVEENYAFAGMHHIFDQHKAAVTSIVFAHDDKSRLACASLDGSISVCQLIPAPATVICLLNGHEKGISGLAWSMSNDHLLSSSYDATARLWDVASGKCIRIMEDPLKYSVLSCVFQPANNNLFATGNSNSMIQVYNISTGKVVKGGVGKAVGKVFSIEFDSFGRVLWAGDNQGFITAFQFDIVHGKLTRAKRITLMEHHSITSISSRTWISREARDPCLLVNCAMNILCLYRITDEQGGLELRKNFPIKHRQSNVKSCFCPLMSFRQGACVVSGSEDCCVYFFDVQRDQKPCINKLQGHAAPVLDVAFNYDESLLASCDASGIVIIWKREQKS